MAATAYGSGGGFSPLFNRSSATWQEQVVSEYLAASQKVLPPHGDFAAAGRATPDVSMASQGTATSALFFGFISRTFRSYHPTRAVRHTATCFLGAD